MVFVAASAGAQSHKPPEPVHSPQFSTSSDLVLINASVIDRHRHPVTGLQKDNFHVLEDKREQTITYFGEEDVPASVIIVFDASGSMNGKLAASRRAIAELVSSAGQHDEFALVSFADRPELKTSWTDNTALIRNSIFDLSAKGSTSLLDAVAMALGQLKTAHNKRHAIVILSDGGDNRSRNTERAISKILEEADIQLYAIDVAGPMLMREQSPEVWTGPSLLSRLCDRAGGRYFEADADRDIRNASEQIGNELRYQYVLGYTPHEQSSVGRFRHVQVKLERASGSGSLNVYWRRGYRIPE